MSLLKFWLTATFLCLASWAAGQYDFDHKVKPRIDCYDVALTAFVELPNYYQQEQLDSIAYYIAYWEEKCGRTSISFRTKTLFEIERDVFDASEIDYNFFNDLIQYSLELRNSYSFEAFGNQLNYGPGYAEYQAYSEFTIMWANNLLKRNIEVCSDARLLLLLYAGRVDEFFSSLQKTDCSSLYLSKFYNEQITEAQRLTDWHLSGIAGSWLPQGNAKLLGVHPSLGFSLGIQPGKFLFDLTLLFRFIRAANTYTTILNGAPQETDHFFGGYVGLDTGYELYRSTTGRLYAWGGIGYDGFDTYPDPDNELDTRSIGSLNLNTGLGYKHFIRNRTYIGLDTKYNFVNYQNPGGTDFSGNAISLNFTIGILGNIQRQATFSRLNYHE